MPTAKTDGSWEFETPVGREIDFGVVLVLRSTLDLESRHSIYIYEYRGSLVHYFLSISSRLPDSYLTHQTRVMSAPVSSFQSSMNGAAVNDNGKASTPPSDEDHRYVTDDRPNAQRKAQIPAIRGSGQQTNAAGLIVRYRAVSELDKH